MARTLAWRRANWEFVDLTESNGHTVQGPFIAEGETVTKIWFNWYAQHFPIDIAAHGVGMGVALGVIMGQNGWTAADVPAPYGNPNADWMWYDAGFFVPVPVAFPDGVVNELDVYPPDPSVKIRVESQRKAPAGGANLWFRSDTSSLSPQQSRHFLCLSYSVGVLLAP